MDQLVDVEPDANPRDAVLAGDLHPRRPGAMVERIVAASAQDVGQLGQVVRDAVAKVRQLDAGALRDVPLDLVLMMKRTNVPDRAPTLMPSVHVELRLPVEDTVRLLEANLSAHVRLQETHQRLLLAAKEVDASVADAEFADTAPTMVVGNDGGGDMG